MTAGGIWTRPRNEQTIAHTTGAIDDTITFVDSMELIALHINFSATPDAETMVVSLRNSAGGHIRTWSFDPTVEYPGDNEITMVFEKWMTAGSGTLNITYDNTSELITSVITMWEYDGK